MNDTFDGGFAVFKLAARVVARNSVVQVGYAIVTVARWWIAGTVA